MYFLIGESHYSPPAKSYPQHFSPRAKDFSKSIGLGILGKNLERKTRKQFMGFPWLEDKRLLEEKIITAGNEKPARGPLLTP
jgi:hypothetical protein